MILIKSTTWNQVFRDWEKREGSNPDWIKCATKIKGWPDWKSWRGFTAQQIGASAREWQIFRFTDPLAEIPEMLVGPFNSWQDKLSPKNKIPFAKLLTMSDKYQTFSQNKHVLSILDSLPFATQFIGLRRNDLDKIVCLEGHHRAVAVTLAKLQKQDLNFSQTEITIALANIPADESRILFDKVLSRGTSKNP